MDLSVSIVTHNSAHCLDTLFASLDRQQGVEWELLILDSASTDGTADALRSRNPGDVVYGVENAGFGRGHNQNLRRARGRHVLLLNPDVEFGEGVFAALVAALDGDLRCAVAGPMILEGAEGKVFPPRERYPGEHLTPMPDRPASGSVAWMSGACLAIRREVFDAVGGFDEEFFLYYEEADLCLRVRRAGWRLVWCPAVEVRHTQFQSQTRLSGYQRSEYISRGVARFWEKHYAAEVASAILRFRCIGSALRLLLAKGARREELRARRDVFGERLRARGANLLVVDRHTAQFFLQVLKTW